MTNPINLSVLISQMPRVQKLQGDYQGHLQAAQEQLAKEAIEKQKREQQQIVKAKQSDTQVKVKPDQERSQQKQFRKGSGKGNKSETKQSDPDNPESGYLIDLEI